MDAATGATGPEMALDFDTFSNETGGNIFFKAVSHPLAAPAIERLIGRLAEAGPVAIYDPAGHGRTLAAIYDLSGLEIAGVYVQKIEHLGRKMLGQAVQPVTELPASGARTVLIMGFDTGRARTQFIHLVPEGAEVLDLDEAKLPESFLGNKRAYLSAVNFAVNHVLFEDGPDRHIRLVSADYWSAYGAKDPELWLRLYDRDGTVLAEWEEALPGANGTVTIDSAAVAKRFDLGAFSGQLFMHVKRAAGHDIVKYALDTYGDRPETLSCTHDANSWPADRYAGLPAPADGERVLFWIQNCQPCPIPPGGVLFNEMGRDELVPYEEPVPAFGTRAVDVASLFPDLEWPRQIEIRAGKHLIRPRYEIVAGNGRRRIAHVNVERTDLAPDPKLPDLSNLLGKLYILPAPLLPTGRFRSLALPTPMAAAQASLPLQIVAYASDGTELGRESLGNLPRCHDRAIDLNALANGSGDVTGHVELTYDFRGGGDGDGWLHALFRYEDLETGHLADTSFGSHIFNTVITYKNEPQSYAGPPPGLSTRLFLRNGDPDTDAFCHLIYPASTPWHAASSTKLELKNRAGETVAEADLAIPCGGSRLWRVSEMFNEAAREKAGEASYVLIRDTSCRLFGYHGLERPGSAFSLDHMFGF